MAFNSTAYLLFLPLVFCLYWLLSQSHKWQNLLIVSASYVFYGWWDARFLLLILASTLCSYACALGIEHTSRRRLFCGIVHHARRYVARVVLQT